MVDRQVAVEALARAGLGVARGQALTAVVRGEHGADARGAAAEERPPFDELDMVTHLGELGGGLRAGHAAADDHDGVVALGVGYGGWLRHQRLEASEHLSRQYLEAFPRLVGFADCLHGIGQGLDPIEAFGADQALRIELERHAELQIVLVDVYAVGIEMPGHAVEGFGEALVVRECLLDFARRLPCPEPVGNVASVDKAGR